MRRNRILLGIAVVAWLALVVAGTIVLGTYSSVPGEPGTPGPSWPAASRISPARDRDTLVMTIHPNCPCSRASLGELSSLVARATRPFSAFVIFVALPELRMDWTASDLWATAGQIPGVTRVIDDGRDARLFGAATSGQTMLYDARGRLLFSGGITAGRGHFGDNPGLDRLTQLLNTPVPATIGTHAVYGCPLFADRIKKPKKAAPCPS